MKYSSLGRICHASETLKRNKLKTESYPFDWILSNSKMVEDCIIDKFETFLDKKEYETIYKDDNTIGTEHNKYCDLVFGSKFGHNPIFNHHDLLNNEEHYNYFKRCVDRFLNLLKSDEPKTFLYFYNYGKQELDDFIKFNEFIGNHTQNHILLVIKNKSNGYQSHKYTKIDNLGFLELTTNEVTNGVNYFDNTDNQYLDNILPLYL